MMLQRYYGLRIDMWPEINRLSEMGSYIDCLHPLRLVTEVLADTIP